MSKLVLAALLTIGLAACDGGKPTDRASGTTVAGAAGPVASLTPEQVASEARGMLSPSAAGRLAPAGSIQIGCATTLRFPVDWAPAVSIDGTRAVLETCDDILVVDTASGKILQRAPLRDYFSVDVRTGANDVEVTAYRAGGVSDFFTMSSVSPFAPAKIALPPEWRSSDTLVMSPKGTPDGRILALEVCSPAIGGCNGTIVFDLESSRVLLQKTYHQERVTLALTQESTGPVLATELRADRVEDWKIELVDLTSGESRIVPWKQLDSEKKAPPAVRCDLREASHDKFVRTLTWPDGSAFDLVRPSRAPIVACTVSSDGKHLLVAVAPFVHRFDIQP